MNLFAKLIILALSLSVSCQIGAETGSAESSVEDIIASKLSQARPDLEFGTPVASPIDGYYQVAIPSGQLIYVSANGEHFFAGDLYFVESGQFVNAAEIERISMRADSLLSISKQEMIIFAPSGETKAVMTVFTDVTCGYCRKLHNQMAEMNALGIEVRYLAYPRSGIERDGVYTREFQQTVKAWCAEDRKATMSALKAGEPTDIAVCEDSPVAEHYKLGTQFGVTGTPAIILEDGRLLPGYQSPQDYAEILGIAVDI